MFFKDIFVIILYIYIPLFFRKSTKQYTERLTNIRSSGTEKNLCDKHIKIMHIIHRWHTLHRHTLRHQCLCQLRHTRQFLPTRRFLHVFGVHIIRVRSASSAICANSFAIYVSICTTLVLQVFSTAYAFLTIIIQN